MEKENMTTPREAAQGADARTESGAAAPAADLGKFKSVDALLNAYNSLEAEFTRRSQRLRELEGKTAENGGAAASGENILPPGTADRPRVGGSENETRSEEMISEKVRDRVITEYLASVRRDAPYVMSGGAGHVSAPDGRARTLEDAAAIAAEIFRKQE